jgi:hypothetical protein
MGKIVTEFSWIVTVSLKNNLQFVGAFNLAFNETE